MEEIELTLTTPEQPTTGLVGRAAQEAQVVRAAHDLLFRSAGLDPAHSYDEILRSLAAIAVTRRNGQDEGALVTASDVATLVTERANAVLDALYPDSGVGSGVLTFGHSSLPDPLLADLLRTLSPIDLSGKADSGSQFGTIFQQVVTSTFRGSLGAYFTPSPIADFIANYLRPHADALVVDPACGSGGLLTAMANNALANGHQVQVAGQDINPRMVLTSALSFFTTGVEVNALVLGDGLTVTPCAIGEADYVVANPPFAGFESRQEVLAQFRTAQASGAVRSLNKTIPFVERIIELLRPGGRAGLVLPISVFNAEESTFVALRELIFDNCQLDAVIGLPTVAFEHTDCGIAGGLLFLTRTTQKSSPSRIFIDQANAVGYDSIGFPIRDNDLPGLLKDAMSSASASEHWIPTADIEPGDRIDPTWWSPANRALRRELEANSSAMVPLTDLCRIVRRPLDRRNLAADAIVEYFEVRDTDAEFGVVERTHTISGEEIRRKGRIKQVVKAGDILMPNHRDSLTSKAGAGSGRSAVLVTEQFDGCATTDRFIVLESAVDPNFLIALLNSEGVRAQLVMAARGSASLDIRDSVLKNVLVPDPGQLNPEAVRTVCAAIAGFRALRDEIDRKRSELGELLRSISSSSPRPKDAN